VIDFFHMSSTVDQLQSEILESQIRRQTNSDADTRWTQQTTHAEAMATEEGDPNSGESDEDEDNDNDATRALQQHQLKYPLFVEKSMFVLKQTTPPRSWCLTLITWSYPFILGNS